MAVEPERVRTSADIAAHAGTNPVVVRRVLGRLLADVYLALDERLFGSQDEPEAAPCPLERALHNHVSVLLDEDEKDLKVRLAEMSISGISEAIDRGP